MDWKTAIKAYRETHGLKQSALADMLGVDQTAVSRWERGRDQPNLAARKRLLALLRGTSTAVQDRLILLQTRMTLVPQAVLDERFIVLEASDANLRLFKFKREDAIGIGLRGNLGEIADEHLDALEQTGIFKGEAFAVRSVGPVRVGDGSLIYLEDFFTPKVGGTERDWLVVVSKEISKEDFDLFVREHNGWMETISYEGALDLP